MFSRNIEQPNQNVKYRRIIWGGTRDEPPRMNEKYYLGSNFSYEDNILSEYERRDHVSLFPILIVYETSSGQTKYVEFVR